MPNPEPTLWFPVAGGALSVLALFGSIRSARRKRLVDMLPTSKTVGVFIGLVELKGTAEAEQPLTGFLSGARSVYYRWSVEEQWSREVQETVTNAKGEQETRTRKESGWKTIAENTEQIPFYLKDDRGIVRVVPAGATIESKTLFHQTCGPGDPLYYGKGPAGSVPDSDHRRRFQETAVPLHAGIFVVGQARERSDAVAPEIAADPKAPLFLISTRSEEQVRGGLRLWFWVLGILSIVLGVAGLVVRDQVLERNLADHGVWYAVTGLGIGFFWALWWGWMVFNSLVELRQRVRQAWANVDVQLKRRSDLIPNLLRAITALRDHERRTQEAVIHLRSQVNATAPGTSGPDPQACRPALLAVTEQYPELKSNEAFLKMQRMLTETEERLALARNYFNDIATFFNTRLETIPDRFIAALGAMKRRPLLTADHFERAVVEVHLSE